MAENGAAEISKSPAAGNPSHRSMPNARRRRLLVGAVGIVPSVYTLASGAQVSATSQMMCFLKQPPTPPARFTPGSDNWFRSTAYSGNYEGHPAHCVTSPQNTCVDPLQPSKAETGSAWIINRSRSTAGMGMGGPSMYDVRVVIASNNQVTNVGQLPSMQGLVYIDQNATIATLDPNGRTGLQPVTMSCANSMMAGRTVSLV
jgi:hypothetical protein